VILRPKDSISKKFLIFQFNSQRFFEYTELISRGTTLTRISRTMLGNTNCFLPPFSEQEQIVKYLDEKTYHIDQLISITEKKIEGLKEKRTSLINHVVTKGLDSNVEVKDSGIEWIGKIPKHWEVIPIKHLVETNQRVLREDTPEDYELDYIEISDVNNVGEIINKTRYFFKETPSRCRRILQKNDVFVSTVRTYLKSIGFVKDEVQDLICSTGFCVLSPNTLKVNPEFLFLLISTEWFLGSVISNSEGVSYPSITSTKLIELKTLLPPLIEQELIVKHIESHTTEIDNLISLEKKRIETLKEYRQSLISEVVTGKIRVCEEVPEFQEN
jgi:type I restriction enzyme S subunit